MEAGRTIGGSVVVTLGDQLRARWHLSTKYVLAVVAVVVVAMTARTASEMQEIPFAAGIAVAAFAVVVTVVGFLALVWGSSAAVTALLFLRLGKAQRAVSYTFGADGFAVRDQRAIALTVPWSAVKRVRETRRAFLVRMKPGGARYLPLRAFAPDDLPRLRSLFAAHTTFKPR